MTLTLRQIKLCLIYLDKKQTAERLLEVERKFHKVSWNDEHLMYNWGDVSEIDHAAYLYIWRNMAARFSYVAEQYDLTAVFHRLMAETGNYRAIRVDEEWYCPVCCSKLNHFSEQDGIVGHYYCPVCLDVGYSDFDGCILFKLKD